MTPAEVLAFIPSPAQGTWNLGPVPLRAYALLIIAGIVVALMVAPITSSIMREVFAQAPIGEREGAIALGATHVGWREIDAPHGPSP